MSRRSYGFGGGRRGSRDGDDGVIVWTPFPGTPAMTHDLALGVTLSGSDVSALADQVGSLHYAQADTARDIPYISSDSDLNGQPSMDPDGSDDVLEISGSKSDAIIKALHDGSGVTYAIGGYFDAGATQYIARSCRFTSLDVGLVLLYNASSQLVAYCARGVSGQATWLKNIGAVSGKACLVVSHESTFGYKVSWIQGGSITSYTGAYAYAASSSDAYYDWGYPGSAGTSKMTIEHLWTDHTISHTDIQAAWEDRWGT